MKILFYRFLVIAAIVIAGFIGYHFNKPQSRQNIYHGKYSVAETVIFLEEELAQRGIPVFAKFDHAINAQKAQLNLRPTTVLVFGSPQIGTKLMIENQSIAMDLPLKIAVWEDEKGQTIIAVPNMDKISSEYKLQQKPIIRQMQQLLNNLTAPLL